MALSNKRQVKNANPASLLALVDALKSVNLDRYQEPFSEMLLKLDENESDLLIELIRKFDVTDIVKYLPMADVLAKAIAELLKESEKSVFCFPLKKPKDSETSKSGDFVHYLIKRPLMSELEEKQIRVSFPSRIKSINLRRLGRGVAVVLVDDFIGSGKSAVECIEAVIASGVPADQIIVAAYVTMKEGRAVIEKTGARTTFIKVLDRGISDNIKLTDRDASLNVMENIESSIGVSKDYRFGFGRSEALALMCYCPNNTFPIFWWSKGGWDGPLRR